MAARENKEKTENERYRDEHYPNLYPCKNCDYWRGVSGSNRNGAHIAMCCYLFVEKELRDCEPDYLNQYCEKFKRKQRVRK